MAILPYKDVADLKATAKRVEEVDKKEGRATDIIDRKWEILNDAEEEAKRKKREMEKTSKNELKHYRLKSVGFGAKAPIIATESRCQSKDLFARLKVCLSSTQVAVIPLP